MSTPLFGKLKEKAQNMEQATDRLGGGFGIKPSDIYQGVLKMLYVGKSDSGSNFAQVIIELDGAGEYREQLYFTTKEGLPYFTKGDKQFPLPGFTVVNDLLQMTAGTELFDANFEEKVVNVYNYDTQKEEPTSVMVAVDAIQQAGDPDSGRISVAILQSLETKQKKVGGEYVDTDETRDVNTIEKVFHPDLHVTILEAQKAQEDGEDLSEEHAVFYGKWLEKNKGQVRDKTKKGGKSGNAGKPPVKGESSAPVKKSLFGKK